MHDDDFPDTDGSFDMSSDAEPCLADGIGLSLEEVRALLAKKHDTAVPVDDPMLMMVTVCNAFLEEQQKLQEKHKTALAAFMTEQTATYVQGVEDSVKKLQESLAGATIAGIQQAASVFAASLSSFRATLYLCTAIMGLSALLNVAVFILR